MGFFPVSFQHWLIGTFSYTACARLPNQDWIQPSSFGIVQVFSLSDRIQLLHNLSTFTPPTAPLQYLVVKSAGLTCVPLALRIVEDAWPASPTCCRRPSQMSESRFSRRLEPSTFLTICGLFVRKLTRSPSHLSLALPSAWKEGIMHGRESCNELPLRSCMNQAPLLICSWYKTVQNSMHLS